MSTAPETQPPAVEAGQFDDAPEDTSDPRVGHAYIDEVPPEEDKLLEWSESESEDESDESDGNERRDTGVSGQGDVLSRAAATQEANIRHAAIKVCLGYT